MVVGFFGYGVSLVLFIVAIRHMSTARAGHGHPGDRRPADRPGIRHRSSHTHVAITHSHEHYSDAHHRHGHETIEIIQPWLYSHWMLTIASRIDVLTRLGRAMADPTRARILVSLLDSPGYPARLAKTLELTRSNVSNHLACLRGCGLVVAVPEGRQTRYEIADPHLTRAVSALTEVVLAVDDAAPCTDDTCTLPGCCE